MANLRFHFCVCMFIVLCLIVCPILCKANLTRDEHALLALKYSVIDPYNYLANWSSNSSSICNWVGVTCDDFNHWRVKTLNLSEMGLKGTLPSQIGNLSFLVELDLHSNNFYGELPKELNQLGKLKYLNMGYNQFYGEIPIWIGNLFSLQHLILENNNLGGAIPPTISNFSLLEHILLSSNSLSGHIPSTIFNMSKLQEISLSWNNLSGGIPSYMCHGLPKIQKLSVKQNAMSGALPSDWIQCKELQQFSVTSNRFNGYIPRQIANLTRIQWLYLGRNFFTEYGSSGVVSTKADVYSYGIILIEVFTRKKPVEDMFVSNMSLRSWVSASVPHAIIQIIDSNLLQGDEQHIGNILTSTCSILELALNCCNDVPETRNNMTDVVASLNKIKIMFQRFGRIA